MNTNLIITFAFLLSSCLNKRQDESIKVIYKKITPHDTISYIQIDGYFSYQTSEINSQKKAGDFLTSKNEIVFSYISHAIIEIPDTMIFRNNIISLSTKYNPLSIKLYEIRRSSYKYLIVLGNLQAASGTGQQITYFSLIDSASTDSAKIKLSEFQSRFGDISSITDFNNDGYLDYFKVVNGSDMNEYILTINRVTDNKQIDSGFMKLKYNLNDKFEIIENKLSLQSISK